MPDLTPAEQAIVDLVEREGPMTYMEIAIGIYKTNTSEDIPVQVLVDAEASLLSRDLLLGRKEMVECPTCDGSGRGERVKWRASRFDLAYYGCSTCSDTPESGKLGTGIVEEWVIGVACTYGCEDGWINLDRNWRGPPGVVREHWIPCVCIDTPGLDPGFESAAR